MLLTLPSISLVIKIFSLVMIIFLVMMILFLVNFKKTNVMIKGLMKQVEVRDELLEQQEEFLVKERKSNEELKKLLILEKCKVEKLDQEFAQIKKTTCSLKSSVGTLQAQHDVLQKTHQDLEVQFDALCFKYL
jgi:chromosome segregation ATPase